MKSSAFTKALWRLQSFNVDNSKSGLLDYATIMCSNIIEATDLVTPTIATDGVDTYVNMQWWNSSNIDVQVFALAHEAEHIRLMHPYRVDQRDPQTWNIACDIYVNEIKFRQGHKVASSYIMGASYGISVSAATTVEQIYDKIKDKPKPRNGSLNAQNPLSGNDFLPTSSSKITQESQLEKIKTILEVAGSLGYDLTKSPELIKQYEELSVSRRDWRKETHNFISKLRRSKWDRTAPIPAYRARRVIVPGIKHEKRMALGIVIDTSGSVYGIANEFIAVIKDAIGSIDPEFVTLMFADDSVVKTVSFDAKVMPKFNIVGGGGTRFWPALRAMEKVKNIGGVIYLTDGYGEYGKIKPSYPLLWVMNTTYSPPFGDVCRI